MASSGLSSAEALSILIEECETVTKNWKKDNENVDHGCLSIIRSLSAGPFLLFLVSTIISAILIAIGSVDMENEISFPLLFVSSALLIFTVLSWIYQVRLKKKKEHFNLNKIKRLIKYIQNTGANFGYSTLPEPLTEDMWGQFCFRDGVPVNVPKILLVRDDVLLLRPGQVVPCECMTSKGEVLRRGDRLELNVNVDHATGASEQLKPIPAICRESLVSTHINECLSSQSKPSFLQNQIDFVLYYLLQKCILIPYILITITVVIIRYYHATSESFYGTRFVFSIPSLIILPLLAPSFPLIRQMLRKWNQACVADSLGIPVEPSTKDYVDIFGRLTGVSIVDKKGVLSSTNPCIDKVIVFNNDDDGQLMPETLGLSSEMTEENRWKLYFDDPAWQERLPNLRPLGLNLQLNSCRHNHSFVSFLDHLSVVSSKVPRTIVAAQRRCMCQFPPLLGFDQESCSQFLEKHPQIIGFYKRQPGDAPLPGLTKHRTPLEMAFCCIHSDSKSMHSHVSCQGTADLVLDACSHLWNGKELVPLTTRLTKIVRDIYQRNSMTGYCLLISYRPTGSTLSSSFENKFIDVPLARETSSQPQLGIRCQSSENVMEAQFFCKDELSSAEEVVDNIFTDHVLCGLVAMQYEALPMAVQLVDGLDTNCIRFVYFSRENELRSRVFAEKLGLEAGWNCHISLAEPFEEKETNVYRDLFSSIDVDQKKKCLITGKKSWLSRSEAFLNRGSEDRFRNSPLRRQSSLTSLKVGAMPNKARLPTGVSHVRPHLDEVDNVPLLVGLFTDCDPEVNQEMLSIMQENEEVVLTIGSSLNTAQTQMYLKSDLSICVPPLLDRNCALAERNGSQGFMANDLAARIMAVSTDFELNHVQLLNLADTVSGCRHRLWSVKTSLTFLFLASAQLSILLFLSALAFLPLIFSTAQVFIAVFLQLPLLFVGTVWTPFHPRNIVIRIAPKNPRESATSIFLFSFVLQFLPTVVVLLFTFFLSLADNATMLCSFSDVACAFGDDLKLSTHEIRHVIGLHFIIYLCVNSAAWIHPLSLCWKENPLTSLPWIGSVLLAIAVQISHSYISGVHLHYVISIPSAIVLLIWSVVLFVINELCKLRNMRAFLREQRRTKLAFDTKLGMNSPY